MKRFKFFKSGLYLAFAFLLCFTSGAQERRPEASKVQLSKDVFIEKISEGVWRHVSEKDVPGFGLVPSNGLIIQLDTKVLMVDTAFTNEQTKLILDWIETELKTKPIITIITHYHADRLGGIHEVHQRGIKTLSSELTAKLAKEHGVESPKMTFDLNINLEYGKRSISMIYPGPGHTKDNAVVWIPDRKILFGGCLVRSAQAKDMGNIKDADLKQWPKTIEKLYKDFGQATIVVPGHGDISGTEALKNTLELLKVKP
jgi:metallo-beta-lactamase class B